MQDRKTGQEHISVCVCTCRRPVLLERLLRALNTLQTGDRFTYGIVIVDNDAEKSAKPIVDRFAQTAAVSVRYDVEPDRSISLARNRAVANAGGSHVAFIDDDECPGPDWLLRLFRAMKEYRADGVLGPVIPEYKTEPPKWVIKGGLCERESFPTGTVLRNPKYTRTGNVMLEMALFDGAAPFDPRYGKSGGEDTEFFRRMMRQGKQFVWCDEAPVWELVPPERMQRTYFVKRALLRGFSNSRGMSLLSVTTLKSVAAVLFYSAALPFCLIVGQHVFMNYLIRNCDHIGKLMGIMGVAPIEKRTF